MKVFSVLLLSVMVATTMEICRTRYILVMINDKDEKGKFFMLQNIFGNSEQVGISKTENFYSTFLANLAKSNRSVDILKEVDDEKENRQEAVGRKHSYTYLI